MVNRRHRSSGFSLVELMVAMAFTLILMAGMSAVFKASLSSLFTSGELMSSARRNRMSIELLGDDLNTAEMFLMDLYNPPSFVQDLPPFCILPNMPITGAGPNDPQVGDELYFYRDLPLPFDGQLVANVSQVSASQVLLAGTDPAAVDYNFTINCRNTAYADQVKAGMYMIFKDFWDKAYIASITSKDGHGGVKVLTGPDANTGVTGAGATGLPMTSKHLGGAGIVFFQPGQYVRYRVEIVKLDPTTGTGIPCLVRDQGLYSGQQPFTAAAAFVTTEAQQIITDNVASFKVYLSTNSGAGWAGLDLSQSTTGYTDGWTGGIIAELNTQLGTSGRPGFQTTSNLPDWFRYIPTLVRVDVGTRTASQRADYAPATAAANTAAYKTLVRSLVFVPRHSGLALK